MYEGVPLCTLLFLLDLFFRFVGLIDGSIELIPEHRALVLALCV